MRFAPTLILPALAGVLLPLLSPVHARDATGSSSSRSLAHLQYHPSRALLDNIQLELCLAIPDLQIDLFGLIEVTVELCLCLRNLDINLQTVDTVTLRNIPVVDVNVNNPTLPAHSHLVCSPGNPLKSACDTGYVLCNNQCVPTIPGCGPSAVARSVKSHQTRITTLERAQKICGSAAVCGVADPKGDYDFECLNVSSDFNSCGGCVTPHPFPPRSILPRGIDCSSIPNARQVSCENSRCVVQQCRRGLTINPTGDGCVSGWNGESR
ncbi:hypothetical protein GGX14DRAFT_431196 [Mycena pura]|uniref:Protein CPL1-like domain-containing protein n=1 Tax=Mycena pura TaxID=153505 RepID=A0AAD6VR94_9AGAR|nr:hypothetical protein GGX14DRAFT_431196 [Mycena pura]